jgi:hypothetical protein
MFAQLGQAVAQLEGRSGLYQHTVIEAGLRSSAESHTRLVFQEWHRTDPVSTKFSALRCKTSAYREGGDDHYIDRATSGPVRHSSAGSLLLLTKDA